MPLTISYLGRTISYLGRTISYLGRNYQLFGTNYQLFGTQLPVFENLNYHFFGIEFLCTIHSKSINLKSKINLY